MSVRFLQLEPTSRCNFTCGFCAGRSMSQSDVALPTLFAALDAHPGITHVELQGEGEPLLHPEFFELVAAIRARGAEVSFITNGSLLNEANVARIVELGVTRVSVSMESADPEAFRRIRGGKLEKVRAGLERLRDARHDGKPAIGLSLTVLGDTVGAFDGLLDFYDELGLDGGVTVQPLEGKVDYTSTYRDTVVPLSPAAADEVLVRSRAHPRVRALEAARSPVRGFYDQLFDGWMPTSRRCPWLDAGLYVDRDGVCRPCCMIKAGGELGTVHDAPESVLARRDALRDELAAGKVPAPCDGCAFARFAVLPRWALVPWGVRGLLLNLQARFAP